MIDPQTRDLLEMVQRRALQQGINLWEALDQAGLLVTAPRRNEIWRQCLQELVVQVDEQPVTAFVMLGGGQNTPLDAVRGVLEYIDFFSKRFTDQKGK